MKVIALLAILLMSSGSCFAATPERVTLPLTKQPTYGELFDAGIRFDFDSGRRITGKMTPAIRLPRKPPGEGVGLIPSWTGPELFIRITKEATLEIHEVRFLTYFPATELDRPTLKEWPKVRKDSKAGWFHINFSGEFDDTKAVLLKFIHDLAGETDDIEAWFRYKMWETTGSFIKLYRKELPQVKLRIGVYPAKETGKMVVDGFLEVDWLNDLSKAPPPR